MAHGVETTMEEGEEATPGAEIIAMEEEVLGAEVVEVEAEATTKTSHPAESDDSPTPANKTVPAAIHGDATTQAVAAPGAEVEAAAATLTETPKNSSLEISPSISAKPNLKNGSKAMVESSSTSEKNRRMPSSTWRQSCKRMKESPSSFVRSSQI